ncbi:remodeling and spacing factor 1-like [Micractinium conductrix]|uniref:Remodeling and spacing factor 1-like n=1 Tax=Micractinium conductrix TaxID=554055 RepID=A0A2P6VNU3_9CHLO|nr:remodeling and spacing factor 1-like [Micractinium conductrix]|eukprot:PSC75766.1 remodeling and spacing factor 1-like [Micractinium conductrix]
MSASCVLLAYEVDASGARVSHRDAGDILDLSQGSWAVDTAGNLSAVTSPVLPSVPVAAFSVPFKASQPACSPASSLPVPLAGTQQFVLQVMIFPNDTIYNPGSGLEPGEVLAGNVKSTLTVTGWPFCNSSHSLVVELAFKSTRLGGVKARAPRVTTGDEAAAAVANLTDSVLAAVGAELADDVAVEGEGELSRDEAVGELAGDKWNNKTKSAVQEKVAKQRPMAGLGRPSHEDRIFVALPGLGSVDSKIDVPAVALVDDAPTNITVYAPSFVKAQGVQRVLLTFPFFESSLTYDPTTFAASDAVLAEELAAALGVPSSARAVQPGMGVSAVLAALAGAALLLA